MDPKLLDLMMRVQSGHATCMFAATQISNEQDRLLSLIEGAANRLESIRETDKSGLILDDDITRLRAALRFPSITRERCIKLAEMEGGYTPDCGVPPSQSCTCSARVPSPTPYQCDGCRSLSQMAHWELGCPAQILGCVGTTI